MTLIAKVIDNAMASDSSVSSLLRQLKVLAVRTGARDTLLPWVDRELTGYSDGDEVPGYRGPFQVRPLGNHVGPWNQQMTNMQVKRSSFDEQVQDSPLFHVVLYDSVAELQACADSKSMRFAWPPEAVAVYNYLIRAGKTSIGKEFVCYDVTYTVNKSVYIGVLDQVRTAVLDLALELETVVPQAGEPDASEATKREAAEVIEQVFNIQMTVNSSNVAIGSDGEIAQRASAAALPRSEDSVDR